MFGKHKPPPLKSLLAAGTAVHGDVHFEDGLRIDGEVHGCVLDSASKPSVVVIGDGAVVNGEVTAEHVIINGQVNGPVTARRLIELQPKAVVHGDVHYQAIELHLGAKVSGRLCPIADAAGASSMPLTPTEASEPAPAEGDSNH